MNQFCNLVSVSDIMNKNLISLRLLGTTCINNSISIESFLDRGLTKLSINDVASFVAQLWCLKVSAMCQAQ